MSRDDLKGLTMGTVMWAVIGFSYALMGIGFKYLIDVQREQRVAFEHAREQVSLAINQAVADRERRFQEVEKGARADTDQRAQRLEGMFWELQSRLDQISQQQAECRADMRNLKEMRSDLKTLLEKRK